MGIVREELFSKSASNSLACPDEMPLGHVRAGSYDNFHRKEGPRYNPST